jgi:serine/threonine protein kinase
MIEQLFAKEVHSKVDLTTEFKKNYLVGKIIGEGAYASVRVAIYKPKDKKIAIKIY